ncbi:hypothetical protein Gotur_024530 [Gossypium turneri]
MALLRCPKIQTDKVYSRATNVLTFLKKPTNITGMSEQWVAAQIKQNGDSKRIPYRNLKDLILAYPDVKKRIDVFVLSIYELVIFLNALGHIDEMTTLISMVSQLFLKSEKGLISNILRKLFFAEGVVATPRRDDITEEKWMIML